MSSRPSFDQLRSRLSGKPWIQFQPCKHSTTGLSTGIAEMKDERLTPSRSEIDPNLLSPPLSVEKLVIPPFKPTDSDITSLSMKNRRRRKAQRHRYGLERASTGDAEKTPEVSGQARKRPRSTSMPDLQHDPAEVRSGPSAACQWLVKQQMQVMHMARRKDSVANSVPSGRRASLPQKPRRWTMPSKAAPTRSLSQSPTPTVTTTIIPSRGRPRSPNPTLSKAKTSKPSSTLSSSSPDNNDASSTHTTETPAMITLRRATRQRGPSSTIRRTSLRPDAIISFPAPKFNRTTSTYFSSFFGLNLSSSDSWQTAQPFPTAVRQSSWTTGEDSNPTLGKASVMKDKVQLTGNTIAAPAFTQVEFLPFTQTHTDQQELLTNSTRRYSTTIVSGGSVHEIIWDENITSSSEGSTSAEPSRKTSKTAKKAEQKLDQGDRRQSVLVEKLEAQLKSIDSLRNSLSSLDSSAHEIKRPAAEKQQRRQSRLQMLTTGFNLGVLSTTATVNKPSTDRSRDMDLKPRLDLDHDISSPDIHGGSFANLPHDDHVSPTTTDVVEFFPPLEGKAGNNSQRSSRRSSSVLPRRHESNELVPVSVEPTSTTSIVPVTGARKEKGRAQSIPTEVVSLHRRRKSSGTGIAFRRSAHIRRRSSERSNGSPDIESFSRRFRTWSITTSSSSAAARRRLSSDQQEGLFAEDDERTPLLLPTDEDREEEDRNRPSGATERSKSESAVCMPTATGAGTGTGTRLQAIGRVHVNIDPRARKMSVQDFVWQIERMNSSINGTTGSRREKGEEAGEGGAGDGDGEAIPGLVRRDSPRLPSLMRTRRVSTGARIRGKGNGNGNIGGGKVLSEVAEEGS